MTVYSLYDEGDKKSVTLNGIDTITAFALIDPVLQPKEKSEFEFCAFASQTNKFIMVILNKESSYHLNLMGFLKIITNLSKTRRKFLF